MAVVTYTNNAGDVMVFTNKTTTRITEFNGYGGANAQITMQKSYKQDGATLIDTTMEVRDIGLDFVIVAKNELEVAETRRQISRLFNPKNMGVFRIEDRNGVVREIGAVAFATPVFSKKGGPIQKGSVVLLCPDPYWRSSTEQVEQLAVFEGGLKFPLVLPTIFGNQKTGSKSRIVLNDGDVSTPILVTFEGPATSPIRIENSTTGEFIEIAQNLLEEEKMIVDTTFGKKRVTKVLADGTEVNAFNHIKVSPDPKESSTFFYLGRGNNLLTYSTGSDFEKAPVTIRFYPRYVSV